MKPLPRSFFQRPTLWVAKNLLGKTIIRRWRGKEIRAAICETEAYIGSNDKACHASRGRTARTEVLFWEAGHAYVYLIYGMHYCFNIVTEKENFPSAVLIRGICVPGKCIKGPGRVSKFLHINKAFHGKDLVIRPSFTRGSAPPSLKALRAKLRTPLPAGVAAIKRRPDLWFEDDSRLHNLSGHKTCFAIKRGPRIGVEYAGSWAKKPWRFWMGF